MEKLNKEKSAFEKLAIAKGISTQELSEEIDKSLASKEGLTLEEYRKKQEELLKNIDEEGKKLDIELDKLDAKMSKLND